MLVYGLTGGIASGKSTVARMIEDEGIPVFDADLVARQVVMPGQKGWKAIVDAFGEEVLAPDRSLDRPKLAAIVFNDAAARKRLEQITHPLIREEIGKKIMDAAARGKNLAFVDAALMIETGWATEFAGVVVVDTTPDLQMQRLVKRDGLSEEAALKRIAAQMSLAEKRAAATHLLSNDGNLLALRRQVGELLEELKKNAEAST